MPTNWFTIVPLDNRGTSLECVPVKFAKDVILCTAPNGIKDAAILDKLALDDRRLFTNARLVLLREYGADSFGDPDPEWRGDNHRSKQDLALEAIQIANFALWIAKPAALSFKRVIHADCRTGTWSRVQFARVEPLVPHTDDLNNNLTRLDLSLAARLHPILLGLKRNGAVWIAVCILWLSLRQEEWVVRYLFLWVALEALFGPEDGREITYRLSQRIALFLPSDQRPPKEICEIAKAAYKWRSKVAHGMKLAKLGKELSKQVMHDTESLIRDTLKHILQATDLIRKFDSKQRERYLDDLIFHRSNT